MEYNTQQRTLPLPEYGRSVQNMVDHALTIEDRAERQRCANTIINIMGGMFPHLRDVPDFKHKLWDHLAIMSNFELDIDYPFDVSQAAKIYTKAVDYPEGEEKKQLISLIANHMKKCFLNWNKDGVEDQKILDDLRDYSKGMINLTPEDLHLNEQQRVYVPRRPQQNNNQRRPQQNNNQRKKY